VRTIWSLIVPPLRVRIDAGWKRDCVCAGFDLGSPLPSALVGEEATKRCDYFYAQDHEREARSGSLAWLHPPALRATPFKGGWN